MVITVGFTLKPSSARVTLGENALFRCQSPGADSIEWTINGIPLEEQTDISIHDIRNEVSWSSGGDVHTLSIAAIKPSYNKTTVKCQATSSDDPCQQTVESPPVDLLIQGNMVYILHGLIGVPGYKWVKSCNA